MNTNCPGFSSVLDESDTGSDSMEQANNRGEKAMEPFPRQNINLQTSSRTSFMKPCSLAKLVDSGKCVAPSKPESTQLVVASEVRGLFRDIHNFEDGADALFAFIDQNTIDVIIKCTRQEGKQKIGEDSTLSDGNIMALVSQISARGVLCTRNNLPTALRLDRNRRQIIK